MTWLVFLCGETGKTSAAAPWVKRLLEIDPLSALTRWVEGHFHLFSGRLDLALESFHKSHQMEPASPNFRTSYAQMLACHERLDEACSILDPDPEDARRYTWAGLGLFFKYALQREKTKALQSVTKELKGTARMDETFSWLLAECYSLLEEKEEALDWLENAANLGFINYPFLSKVDPYLENVRGEDRFKRLMEKVKYDWEHLEV